MTVYPIKGAEADRKHWVVRWLRYTGYAEIIAAVAVGLFYAYSMLAPMLFPMLGDSTAAIIVSLVLGGIGSLLVGLALTLPVWALAMVIDDLHAMRQYMQGFAVSDRREV